MCPASIPSALEGHPDEVRFLDFSIKATLGLEIYRWEGIHHIVAATQIYNLQSAVHKVLIDAMLKADRDSRKASGEHANINRIDAPQLCVVVLVKVKGE